MSDRNPKKSKKHCRIAKAVKPPAFQVYLPEAGRELIRRAIAIKSETETRKIRLSDFIGGAALAEARRVLAQHPSFEDHTKHTLTEEHSA